MPTVPVSALVLFALVYTMSSAAAQTPVGALAVDERQGDQYGWAVDYETAAAAQAAALRECGGGCRVVLTFNRCAAYAVDQDADNTAVGWAESFASSSSAQQAALSECNSRGGTGCIVRVWGCNGPVVEEGLGLDRAARQQIQRGLEAAGFDPGGADGLFGPRTRAAIRGWQRSRGSRATGYLDGASVSALRPSALGQPTFREREPASADAAAAPAVSGAQHPAAASAELEGLFWQSVMNSTNPAEFEAYLAQFPNGVFRALAEARLSALRGSVPGPAASAGSPPAGTRVSGAPGAGSRRSAAGDSRTRPPFRAGPTCAGQPAGTACWMALADRPGCSVWNPGLEPGATVTWTAACADGVAHGSGTLTWTVSEGIQTNTGRLEAGQFAGHWVVRFANGNVSEGPMVGGEPNGHWVQRFTDGGTSEGSYVAGERNGHWIHRFAASGNVGEGPYVNGEQTGHWVFRTPDGTVVEGPLVDGERHGDWVVRRPDGRVEVERWEYGERVDR